MKGLRLHDNPALVWPEPLLLEAPADDVQLKLGPARATNGAAMGTESLARETEPGSEPS